MPKKLVKVILTDKVSTYHYQGKVYYPGDIFEVPAELLPSHIFEKVIEPKAEPTPKPPKEKAVKVEEEPKAEEEHPSPLLPSGNVKKKS